MRSIYLVSIILAGWLIYHPVSAQQNDTTDMKGKGKEEQIKKGIGWSGLPVISFNSDIGFQYGLIANLFQFGDGSYYPDYKWSLYAELSRTTRGSGVNQVFFDAKNLIPGNIRVTADLSYLTELNLNFYGFNGYDAVYRSDFENDESLLYRSRMYYRYERKMTRFIVDFTGNTGWDELHWFAGIGYFDLNVGTVDIDRLNKKKKEEDILPDTSLLYDEYVKWGIIGEKEKNGGNVPSLKLGLIYDSRDHEANPMKGIWSEALLFYSMPVFGNNDYSYLKLAVTHRQYFTLIRDKLSLVYRLGYQGTLAGKVPFYMEPYMISSFAKTTTTDGLGGAKTVRGILRNRVVGDGIGFGNLELRWKIFRTVLWNQNFYFALNAFTDAGRVLRRKEVDPLLFPDQPAREEYYSPDAEDWHVSAGGGFSVVHNSNFVVAFDYGRAFDRRDGLDGFYLGIGYMF